MKRTISFALAGVLSVATPLAAAAADAIYQTDKVKVRAETIARGLKHPWGMEILPDGAILVTERPGQMRIVADGVVSKPLRGVPKVGAAGQGGLLDVALATDHVKSGVIFFTYSEPGSRADPALLSPGHALSDPRLADGFDRSRRSSR